MGELLINSGNRLLQHPAMLGCRGTAEVGNGPCPVQFKRSAPLSQDALGAALDRQTGGDRGQRVFLRADKGVAYGDLMGVMNTLRQAGYHKVALVGPEDGTKR